MKVTAANFDEFRDWFAIVLRYKAQGEDYGPDVDPMVMLENVAATSPSNARKGLGMAIGDLLEMSDTWPRAGILQVDEELSSKGLPTLTAMKLKFGKVINRALKRGKIGSQEEYYLLRNAAEMSDMPDNEIWKLLSEYESTVS